MIVRDEEATVGHVLADVESLCDEVVVVDTGSIDSTKQLCTAAGAKVYDFDWIDDFAAARNFSLERCTRQWVLWLDADDRVPPAAVEGFADLKEALETQPDISGVLLSYRREFSEKYPDMCLGSIERERLVRNREGLRWREPVHEYLEVGDGSLLRWPSAWVEHRPLPSSIERKKGRNLGILQRMYASGDRRPRTLFYLANELRDHGRWQEALPLYEEYVAQGGPAWEQHAALRFMAVCAGRLGLESDRLDYLFRAIQVDPARAEPWMQIALHHYEKGEWAGAVPFLAAAASLTRPQDGVIEELAYTWGPWELLSFCHSELGAPDEALDEAMEALRQGSPDRDRLFGNIDAYLNRLK